jgi:hypothetical protein
MEQRIYTKEKPLTFQVIKKSERKISLFQGIMMTIVIFLLVYGIMYKTYYRDNIAASARSAILFVVLLIVVFIVNYLLHKFKYIGEFTITDNEIILNASNKTTRFPINEISNLKIICRSAEEKRTFVTELKRLVFGKPDGKGNCIEFTHKGNFHTMEIYLRGKQDAMAFMQRAKELMSS